MNDRDQRLKEVAGIAAALERQTRCPARLLIAQWAIESQWGKKPVGNANYFGIKRAARHSRFCVVTTHEVFTTPQLRAWNRSHPDRPAQVVANLAAGRVRVRLEDEFADYDSLAASCEDYAWLITKGKPYQTAWRRYLANKNVAGLVTSVSTIYATAPQYAEMATQIAGQQNLLDAIAGQSRSSGPSGVLA